MKIKKQWTISAALFSTALLASTSVLAASATQTTNISTDFVPTISLGGTAFMNPTSPTSAHLVGSSAASIGSISISSNTTNCSMAVSTANNFSLVNGANVLATYGLFAGGKTWDSTNSGATELGTCSSFSSLQFQRRSTDTYDTNVPGGAYGDTISITVANQ